MNKRFEPSHKAAGHSQEPAHQSGSLEQHNRVHPKDDERFRPTLVSLDIDQPVTQREKLQSQSAGEEYIRAGPERLVDWEERIPTPTNNHTSGADNK